MVSADAFWTIVWFYRSHLRAWKARRRPCLAVQSIFPVTGKIRGQTRQHVPCLAYFANTTKVRILFSQIYHCDR